MSSDLFAMPSAGIARVALPVPVDRLFDYAIPAQWSAAVMPGQRVRVRFDRRSLTGVVMELAPEARAEARAGLRPLEALLESSPALPLGLLRILVEEATAVLCPIGLAVAAALPPGSAPSVVAGYALTARGREALRSGAVTEAGRELLTRLESGARSQGELRRGGASALLELLLRDGLIQSSAIERGPRARERRVRRASVSAGVDLEASLTGPLARSPRQAELLRELARNGPQDTADLAARIPGAAGGLRALEARGLVTLSQRAAPRPVLGSMQEADKPVVLTDEQQHAVGALTEAIRGRSAGRFLLHGVTGSGKTEVYLRAIAASLAEGRQALVLVPEITLTHQILARLRARFGQRLAVLHSGLRPGARLEQWALLRAGGVPIAVGARSALFAPLEDLGVIVMDEEHEPAYKNEEGFRYHARDLAWRRARAAGCPLVLGSATPALETRHAAERGEIRRIVLSHRIGGRPLPAVQLVDLVAERARLPRGRKLVLSAPLLRGMREVLREGGQSLLFLNRRGFSTQIHCFACGHVEKCKHCDLSLVYHATGEQLRCHYCDYHAPPPEACTHCGSAENALLGIGTQRLEEEVRTVFPDARIARLDRDTASRQGVTESTLRDFQAREIDVLLGTQIVAKGHDFPGVQLVGVINADIGLHFPDFRAAERTFQLLTQVAGRAGRGGAPGRVVVQTYVPEHYALRPVVNHDYEGFYRAELVHRRSLGYPPWGQLARLLVSGPEELPTREAAAALLRAVPTQPPIEVLGPAAAPLARLRGRYRFQAVLKSPDRESLQAVAQRLVEATVGLAAPLRASVDIQPYDML